MRHQLPNILSFSRIVLTPVFFVMYTVDDPLIRLISLVVYTVAALTDYFDGHYARKMGVETSLGVFLDPLADKILVAAALVSLAWSHDIPAWAAIILISRDFLITGLRQLALSDGVVLAADPAGKTKTASQMILIGFFLVRDAVGPFVGLPPWPAAVIHTGQVLIGASVLLSVYSGWRYTRAHWNMVIQSGRS
jgi:CDP-diacylglycerol--glycerol-3-phosphate 3-phosphatidyltransferase